MQTFFFLPYHLTHHLEDDLQEYIKEKYGKETLKYVWKCKNTDEPHYHHKLPTHDHHCYHLLLPLMPPNLYYLPTF